VPPPSGNKVSSPILQSQNGQAVVTWTRRKWLAARSHWRRKKRLQCRGQQSVHHTVVVNLYFLGAFNINAGRILALPAKSSSSFSVTGSVTRIFSATFQRPPGCFQWLAGRSLPGCRRSILARPVASGSRYPMSVTTPPALPTQGLWRARPWPSRYPADVRKSTFSGKRRFWWESCVQPVGPGGNLLRPPEPGADFGLRIVIADRGGVDVTYLSICAAARKPTSTFPRWR